ncbi:uncharacterized protein ACO6RY_03143 [Pungitius sinensis]
MAEARPEQEDTARREQVVRRPPSSAAGRPDRRKPEHRHSQGPLSSIRAAIKRTSTSSTSPSEASRDRDRERDRRRPEITILSAEPLSSAPWFPGASGGFPPPPPPAAQIWGATIPPAVEPPPSYEEVIREKTQEQVLLPPLSSSSSLITISTQTDTGSAPRPEARGPERPPRPPLCRPPRPSLVDDITLAASRSSPDLLAGPRPTSTSGAQTDQRDQSSAAAAAVPTPPTAPTPAAASSPDPSERPTPRPRTRLGARPIDSDVRVQTLVKLREDGAATLAARAGATANQEAGQGKYLQELLEAFSTDDWGFPDRRSDSSGDSQSESEEEKEKEKEEEDMATLRARILAFEQQQGADGSGGDGDFVVAKRPEPRPRPRLQGQPAKSVPPTVAPKPKSLSQTPKPSSKVFWEDGGLLESSLTEAQTEPAPPMNAAPALEPPPCSNAEKPSVPPKPTDPPARVPAPRPPPPKSAPSLGEPANPKPPPRPPVAPRAPLQDKSTAAPPTLPARPSVEAETGDQAETRDADKQTVKVGSRPGVPTKPAALVSPRRASAPNLAPKPAAGAAAPRPSGPTAGLKPPAPALRKGPRPESMPAGPNPSDPPLPPRPSSAKHLPLRPPPIKSTPGRPPPPTISSAHSANQTAPPADKTGPAPSAGQCSPSATTSVSANQMQPQPASKRGPPLPPRPKSGHPLYDRYVKQEVLIVLDDPPPSEHSTGDGGSQTVVDPPQCLLDVDTQPGAPLDQDGQSKPSLEGLGLSESQSILPIEPKGKPDPPPVSGPRCVALFDYEGEEDDELTFSQGDVIGLLQLVGAEWGRGQIHGRVGVFPLNFVEVVEPPGGKPTATPSAVTGRTEPETPPDPPSEEWAEALFDFPAQTADDLSFHKGALIQVMEHLDPQWRRGRLEGREGIYPAAFTQRCQAQPITGQQTAIRGVAKFDFTAESEDELTLKVGDIITQVEFVDERWILGVVDRRRGIVPKNYISLLR